VQVNSTVTTGPAATAARHIDLFVGLDRVPVDRVAGSISIRMALTISSSSAVTRI
jgi:hypothetical protein